MQLTSMLVALMGYAGPTGRRMAPPKPTGRKRPGWHSPERMERAEVRRIRKGQFRQRQYDGAIAGRAER